MKVIVDTSIWVEFFQRQQNPQHPLAQRLWTLLESDQLATLYPIQTEILSGPLTPAHLEIFKEAFSSMTHLDLAWEKKESWQQVAELATKARKKKIAVPGLVDRMILASAIQSKSSLWTRDKKLLLLAKSLGAALIEE